MQAMQAMQAMQVNEVSRSVGFMANSLLFLV
jgi:hypothetical protein